MLFVLGMAVVLLPGMSLTAYALGTIYDPATTYNGFGDLNTNNTEVTISEVSGKTWYVIGNDSSTVTLLSKESFGKQIFNSTFDKGKNYETSDIKTYVDGLTGEGQPLAGISGVISGLTLIDTTTAKGLSVTKRKGEGEGVNWWLSSLGTHYGVATVIGYSGTVDDYGFDVIYARDVRPALKLDLTKVTFDSTTNTFSLKSSPTPEPSPDNTPASEPKHEQDQTLVTGFITNGNDANGNPTYAYFSQENVWSVTKVSSNANSITYDITPQWETYGTVNIGIPAPGFPDGPVQVDHYKNGKLIATYNGWVTSEWCTFDNPDGYSTFVIRKPGTNAQTAKRAYVPNTGVE